MSRPRPSLPALRAALAAGTLLVLLGGILPLPGAAGDIEAAPILQDETEDGSRLRRVLGPFFEFSHDAQGRELRAVRPFWSLYRDPVAQSGAMDILWPLGYWTRQYDPAHRYRYAFLMLYTAHIEDKPEGSQQGSYFLPFYFHTSKDGKDYFALFPLGGHIKDTFGQDDTTFWLFPLYLHNRKGAAESYHVLWPLYARIQAQTYFKHRFFPFYGYAEYPGRFRNSFVLWPFWQRSISLNENLKGGAWFLFPLVGHVEYDHVHGSLNHVWTVLWPLFSFRRTEAELDYHMPWPFIQYGRSLNASSYDKFYLWPLYGHKLREREQTRFWLWPFIHLADRQQPERSSKDRYFIPFVWSSTATYTDGTQERYNRAWPFASKYVDRQGHIDFRMLSLWPQRRADAVARNHEPLWTLYQYRSTDKGYRHDLLWGLWQYQQSENAIRYGLFPLFSHRHERTGLADRTDLACGLLGTEKDPEGRRHYRLLWFLKF